MNSRKTLKSVSVDDLNPTIILTPIIEPYGEGYRIHHIKSFSIAHCGRDIFIPLRHVSKQKRRIFELEEENDKLKRAAEHDADVLESLNLSLEELQNENTKLRELCLDMGICVSECEWDCSDCPRYDRCNDGVSEFIERMHELGIEVD